MVKQLCQFHAVFVEIFVTHASIVRSVLALESGTLVDSDGYSKKFISHLLGKRKIFKVWHAIL